MSSSANPVGMREKYFPIFSHRLDLGIQPLCAWIAWILASWRAMSLFEDRTAQNSKLRITVYLEKTVTPSLLVSFLNSLPRTSEVFPSKLHFNSNRQVQSGCVRPADMPFWVPPPHSQAEAPHSCFLWPQQPVNITSCRVYHSCNSDAQKKISGIAKNNLLSPKFWLRD